jgi:NTP pyrophosphatase (non-canonical NTP hydrolase)
MIYNKALNHFGAEHQLDKLIEEMSELTQAIIKARHKRHTNVSEEIADVQILLDQAKLLHPDWETWQALKLKRLEKLINNV